MQGLVKTHGIFRSGERTRFDPHILGEVQCQTGGGAIGDLATHVCSTLTLCVSYSNVCLHGLLFTDIVFINLLSMRATVCLAHQRLNQGWQAVSKNLKSYFATYGIRSG